MSEEFEPRIVAFCCNWCTYNAADGAGTARMQYPPNAHIIRTMCSGMVHPNFVTEALMKGADGVLVCGCHIGDCHYKDGNVRAESRAEAIRLMLDDLGIEQERFRLEWVSASESAKFGKVVAEMTETIKALGPSPFAASVAHGAAQAAWPATRKLGVGPTSTGAASFASAAAAGNRIAAAVS